MGASGSNAAYWTSQPAAVWESELQALAPDAVIIRLGINDANAGATPAQFQASMATLVSNIQTALPLADIVLTQEEDFVGSGQAVHLTYAINLISLAHSTGSAYFDLYQLIGPESTGNTRGLYGDTTHLNSIGGRLVASAMLPIFVDYPYGPAYDPTYNRMSNGVQPVAHAIEWNAQPQSTGIFSANEVTWKLHNTAFLQSVIGSAYFGQDTSGHTFIGNDRKDGYGIIDFYAFDGGHVLRNIGWAGAGTNNWNFGRGCVDQYNYATVRIRDCTASTGTTHLDIVAGAADTTATFQVRGYASDGTTLKWSTARDGETSMVPVLTSALPSGVATTGTAWRASVSDATTPAIGVALTGGGLVFANVHCSLTTGTYIVDGI